jgi:hypothetical protein
VFVKILKTIQKIRIFKKIKENKKNSKISKIELIDIGMERNATEAHFHFVPRKVLFSFSECRNRVFIHAGPKLGITNSKNPKKCETFVWRHFISPRCEKKLNLEKLSIQESLFTEMTYHVGGCMTFRSNELGLALIMA